MYSLLRRICSARFQAQTRLLAYSNSVLARAVRCSHATVSGALVDKIERQDGSRMLQVIWKNRSVNRFPFVYLRDICRCSSCFHESSLQRSYDTVANLDLNIVPKQVEVLQDGKVISVTWPDQHVSLFDSEWLHSKRLVENEVSSNKSTSLNREGVEFWDGAKLQGNIPLYDFTEILEDDSTLFNWLNSLHRFGISLVTNTLAKEGESERLCKRVGYLKTTHYGHKFEVKAKYDANNLAYTSNSLALHTDLPYFDYVPGIQMLHCIEQVPGLGGANQFVDGFFVAQELKNKYPEKFELLAENHFQFIDLGKDTFGDFNMKFTRPLIELNKNNQIVRFTLNNHTRDAVSLASPAKTQELYEAYLILGKMTRDPSHMLEHKMAPGEIMTFDNARVLHGRSAFTVTREGSRLLEGAYMDWDAVYSRMRSLATKLNIPFNL